MATKFGRMVTYPEELLWIKSHDPLIMWSCKIAWQTKITISLLSTIIIPLIFCIKYRKTLLGMGKRQKLNIIKKKFKHPYNYYEKGGLKNIDLRNKITGMECSWVKRLLKDDFHDWKVIPLYLISKHLGKSFKLHDNFDINNDSLSNFLSFYQDIFIKWINNYTAKPTLPSMILSELNRFN